MGQKVDEAESKEVCAWTAGVAKAALEAPGPDYSDVDEEHDEVSCRTALDSWASHLCVRLATGRRCVGATKHTNLLQMIG